MEGQYGGGALPCICNEGTRLHDVLACQCMRPINIVARRQLVSGSMGVETAKNPNSIILKWLETTSCTNTLSTTTTINDTHLLVWRLFGQQRIGQTESSASSSASMK